MYLIPHALFGAALAYSLGWPGLVLAFASHYLLDMIPHTHYSSKIGHHVIVASFALLLTMVVFIIKGSPMIILGAAVASIPDLDDLFVLKSKNKVVLRYNRWHSSIQNETGRFIGTLTQILTVLVSLILLFMK